MSETQPLNLAGVIGYPIAHSKSPRLHGHWLAHHGIQGHYIPMSVAPEDLQDTLRLLPKLGFRGINVTIPHKERVLALSDSATEAALKIGAANTLSFESDGRVRADNTDAYGFLENIKKHAPMVNLNEKTALCLGAGGASRAVLYALTKAGISRILLANRTQARADALAELFTNKVEVLRWGTALNQRQDVDMIVNSTSLGMTGQSDLPFSKGIFGSDMVVNDLVYTPLRTSFLTEAKNAGATTVDGLGMLLHQAKPGFQKWFGTVPTIDEDLRKTVIE